MPDIQLPNYEIIDRYNLADTKILELSNWALRSFQINLLHKHTKGKGIKVLVCDTGVGHKDITPVEAIDFTGGNDPTDRNGHGCHVAGTIAANGEFVGIAPECELYVAKVLADDGTGSYEWLANALLWGLEKNVDIVNLSLGGQIEDDKITGLCEKYEQGGKIIICAAGNERDQLNFPSSLQSTIAVGAVNRKWQRAYFSDFGPRLTVMAPGVELLAPYLGNGYAKLSGTSMASPIVAAIVALAEFIFPTLTVPECIYMFKETCKDIGKSGWDEKTGHGIIQPRKFLNIKAEEKSTWWAWIVLAALLLIK